MANLEHARVIGASRSSQRALLRRLVLRLAPGRPPEMEAGGGKTSLPVLAGAAPLPRAALATLAELACDGQWRHFGVADDAVVPTDDPGDAVFSARCVERNFGIALAVVSHGEDLLVNGFPALRFSLLAARSSLALPSAGAMMYVAEKTGPYVGPPPAEILGKECPICKIAFDAATRVGGCRCGQFYHFETPESHPEISGDNLLRCFEQARVCSCRAALTTAEHISESEEEQ